MLEMQQLARTLETRIGRIETTLQQTPQLLSLLQEVEMLKSEVAKLRGQAEVQTHQMESLGKRQNDLYADLDQRLGELSKASAKPPVAAESPPPAVVAEPPAAKPPAAATSSGDSQTESRSYETALAHFRDANYAAAIAGFRNFLKTYPSSSLAPNAQYWVGYAYYALKDYKSALAHQQKLVAAYPTSAKVPDALLNVATNQIALDDLDGARKTLEYLVAKHPGTNAATLASRRLAALK